MKKYFGILLLFLLLNLKALSAQYNLEAIRLYNLGLEQYRVGAYSVAKDYFKSAIDIQNDFYDAYYNLATIHDYLGDTTSAIMLLESVLQKVPEDSSFLYKLAQIYYEKGDAQKSLSLLNNIAPTSMEYNQARQLVDRINSEKQIKQKYEGQDKAYNVVPFEKKIVGINAPTGIASDLNGYVYVASYSDNAIFKLMPNNIHQLFSKNPMINGPIGLAFDKNSNLYVANYNNNNILKIDMYGKVSVFVEYSNKPYSLYVKDNILYVSEQGSNTILRRKLN